MNLKVAYQGVPGAYSHIAAQNVYPDSEYVACETFAEAMNRVQSGEVDFAVIPVENSTAGRVSDVHFLLPKTGLSIVGEYFLPIHHQLLALKGAKLQDIKTAMSHPQALAQSAEFWPRTGLFPRQESIPQSRVSLCWSIMIKARPQSPRSWPVKFMDWTWWLKILKP